MPSTHISEGSYARYDDYDVIPYRLIKYLMDKDEMIWKLLKYNTPDAWNKPDLTKVEKGAMIYDGSDITTKFRVFMDRGQPDVDTFENCQLRIANYSVFPEHRVLGTLSIIFELYPHYKTNHLSNYKTRGDMIMQRLFQVFNGALIPNDNDGGSGTIGRFFFDRHASESNRQELGGQLPYLGKWAIMSVKSG